MSYGLEVRNAAGTLVIDGNSSSFSAFQVVGTTSTTTGLPISTNELYFANRTSGAGRLYAQINGSNIDIYGASTVLKVKPAKNFTVSTADEYGLQVKDQSGNIAYDSRYASTGASIKLIAAPFSLSGGNSTGSSATNEQTGTDLKQSGISISDHYMLMTGSYYSQVSFTDPETSLTTTTDHYRQNYYYTSSNIYFWNGGKIVTSGTNYSSTTYYNFGNQNLVLVMTQLT